MDRSGLKFIEERLQRSILQVTALSGGSINRVYLLETLERSYVLKVNAAGTYPGMFEAEAEGLNNLRSTQCLRIPEVLFAFEEAGLAGIVMEYLQAGPRQKNFWEHFGTQLAALHRNRSEKFGYPQDNYIGSLKQKNTRHLLWIDFYMEERLVPQWDKAIQKGYFKKEHSSGIHIRDFREKLEQRMPVEAPALLHGDLWNGNFIVSPDGHAALIDPAVYYGHREMDLAMTKLFGGFDELFYTAYHAAFPLEPGWEKRIGLFQLYPLLIHVNLFGGGYEEEVRSIMQSLKRQ